MNRLLQRRIPVIYPATLLFGLLIGSLPLLHAQEMHGADDGMDSATHAVFTLNGFVSASYSYNFNRPPSGTNGFRVFDFDDNEFKPDVAQIVLRKEAEQPKDVGFRMDLAAGASIPVITASAGLFRAEDGTAEDIDLQQAFVTYVAPVGDGLTIDFGKFATWAGYELVDGYDGYNDNATRSFLFGYAIPFSHAGVRLSYPVCETFSVAAMLVSGWDVIADNNDAKSFGARLGLEPNDELALSLTYIGGAEADTNDSDMRHLVDFVATWMLSNRFSVGLNVDYGTEAGLIGPDESAVWQGAAGYVKFGISDQFSVALRGEVFDDRDGVRTGTPQTLKEVTLTPEFSPAENVAFRADVRLDYSNRFIFEHENDRVANNQPTVSINGVFSF